MANVPIQADKEPDYRGLEAKLKEIIENVRTAPPLNPVSDETGLLVRSGIAAKPPSQKALSPDCLRLAVAPDADVTVQNLFQIIKAATGAGIVTFELSR